VRLETCICIIARTFQRDLQEIPFFRNVPIYNRYCSLVGSSIKSLACSHQQCVRLNCNEIYVFEDDAVTCPELSSLLFNHSQAIGNQDGIWWIQHFLQWKDETVQPIVPFESTFTLNGRGAKHFVWGTAAYRIRGELAKQSISSFNYIETLVAKAASVSSGYFSKPALFWQRYRGYSYIQNDAQIIRRLTVSAIMSLNLTRQLYKSKRLIV